MDKDTSMNIQDGYLGRARKERAWLVVYLNSGKKIVGRIRAYDRYTVILEDRGNEQMVFKHAIATINVSRSFANSIQFDKGGSSAREPRPSPETAVAGDTAPDGRPSEGD
ncbi:MAG TPA: RNA chaperone Hfq [Candidatus Polarisedimenticolia bacterium]|nr:RNA chaperone Hfq [Candidatus Polarisedimenticolia bacterium]